MSTTTVSQPQNNPQPTPKPPPPQPPPADPDFIKSLTPEQKDALKVIIREVVVQELNKIIAKLSVQ
jgi:hypothetical protein